MSDRELTLEERIEHAITMTVPRESRPFMRQVVVEAIRAAADAAAAKRDKEWNWVSQRAVARERQTWLDSSHIHALSDSIEKRARARERELGPCGKHPRACWVKSPAGPLDSSVGCSACAREQRAVEGAVKRVMSGEWSCFPVTSEPDAVLRQLARILDTSIGREMLTPAMQGLLESCRSLVARLERIERGTGGEREGE